MPAPQAAPVAIASPGPWGARGGPSFLQTALSTAAGVAGGALLFQGIERMLGYGGSPFAGAAAAQPVEEVIVNNNSDATPKDASAPSSDPASDPGNDPGFDPNDPSFAATPVDDPDFNSGDDGSLGGGDGFQDV
jgi:hypothetical protein